MVSRLNTNIKGNVLDMEMEVSEQVKSVEGDLNLSNTG